MTEKEVLKILETTGAFITNSHIVCTSGRHSSTYVNKDAVYPHTQETSALGSGIAKHFIRQGIGTVIAPVIGGAILCQWVAYHLNIFTAEHIEVLSVYAEKEGYELVSSSCGPLPPKYEDKFVIKRGYDKLVRGKKVLVVDDVLTTGGSAKKVVEAVRQLNGNVVGVGALCNRNDVTANDIGNVPELFSLLNLRMDSWPEEECPLCAQCVPINTDVGKGREFLARQK